MNCWDVLGIEPTRDRDRISQAYDSQMKFASEQEAKDLDQAFRKATGEMPPEPQQAEEAEEAEEEEKMKSSESASTSPEAASAETLSADDSQIAREVVIQIKALLNDDQRQQDVGIWKAILCEPPADHLPIRRKIARQLEPQLRPMAENGSFPQPVAKFLGDWFEWFSVSEVSQQPDPRNLPEAEFSSEPQPEDPKDQPPQMVNFWPAVIGWIVGLVLLATIFGGLGGG